MTERPNAQDYRNKGERDAAYWREQADKLAAVLAEAAPELRIMAEWAHPPISDEYAAKFEKCSTALAEYNAVRLA